MAKKTTKKSSSTLQKPTTSAKKPVKAKPPVKLSAKPQTKSAPKTPARSAKPAPVVPVARKAVAAKAAPKAKVAKTVRPVKRRVLQPVVETKPAAPVMPEKIKSILSSKDLEKFRELLLVKRRELLGDVNSMEDEALRNSGNSNLSNLPIHMADMGTDNYEQEFTLGLVEKDRKVLREIHVALMKIQDGTYGICEGTGKPIAKARLEAQPWTRYSIEHARKLEQRVRPM